MGRRTSAFAVVLLALSLTACSRYASWQLQRADKLVKQARYADAIPLYSAALDRIPASDAKWLSRTWMQLAECYWRTDRANDAFNAYEHAVDYDQANLTAHLRLGEIYLASSSPYRAAERARLVLKTEPENAEALSLLGAAAAAQGNTTLAEMAYEHALSVAPARTSVSVAYADLLNRDDKVDAARAVLMKAIELDPKDDTPWLAAARLEEQEGDTAAAEAAYRKAVAISDDRETNLRLAQFLERASRIDEARALLRRVDLLQPALPIALGDSELNGGNAASALESYFIGIHSRALQTQAERIPLYVGRKMPKGLLSSQQVAVSRAAIAARVVEADLQLAADESGPAAPASTKAARLHLDQYRAELDAATITLLEAEIALAENDISAAASKAAAAVKTAPESASALYLDGFVKYRTGDRGGALDRWTEALQKDAHFVPARLALASHELYFGSPNTAEDYVVQTVRDEPANLIALELYARVLAAQKNYDAAELIARRAASVDKKAAEPHTLLGEFALAQKKYAVALAELEQAVLLEPHNAHALDALTRVYNTGVITKPVLERFERVANTPPASATLMEVAGRLYAQRTWFDDARRCFRRSLEIDSTRQSAAIALAEMESNSGSVDADAMNALKQMGGHSGALINAVDAESRNDVAGAMKSYEVAVRQGERDGVAANNLAWLLAQKGDLDRALSYAERAQKYAAKDPAVLDTLGYIHLLRREYSQAVFSLQEAQRLARTRGKDPERPGLAEAIHDHLWEAYLRSGDTMSAGLLANSKTAEASATPSSRQTTGERLAHPSIVPPRNREN